MRIMTYNENEEVIEAGASVCLLQASALGFAVFKQQYSR